MSRANLRAGDRAGCDCSIVVVPHDGEHPARCWLAPEPLTGVWQAVSVAGTPDHAAAAIRAMPPCRTVALFSSDEPRGQVLR